MDSDKPQLIQLHQLRFHSYISEQEIARRVAEIGSDLNRQLVGSQPVFLVMLKGAFIFAADLIRASGLSGEVDFVRTQSYHGTESSGKVDILLPPDPELVASNDIILIEDIIDSGLTMQAFLPQLQELQPKSVTLVTLLHKPEALQVDIAIDHIGFSIPDKFVVGYGLDYDGLGRELPGIYQVMDLI